MKKLQLLFASFIITLCFQSIKAQAHTAQKEIHGTEKHIMLNEGNLEWKAGPASLPPGAQMAMLEGDLTKPAAFTLRLKLPGNYKIGPHFHPAIEHVTVVKGNFHMGTGKDFNKSTATRIMKGGFTTMPIGQVHYAFTGGETIIQLHGVGPWGITYVSEADDPRKK